MIRQWPYVLVVLVDLPVAIIVGAVAHLEHLVAWVHIGIIVVAIAAEAMTAALAAGRRRMDWFGVCVLAVVTALGGGTMRDTLLGHYPLSWVADPNLLLIACGAALVTIALARFMETLRWPFLILDALGLVVFTIIGCNVAMEMGQHPIIVIVAGMITHQ